MMGIGTNYRMPSIPSVSLEEVRRQDRAAKATSEIMPVEPQNEVLAEPSVPRKPNASLENISITPLKQDDFGTIGRDRDLMALDMQKAISDLQKDELLKDYRVFVGANREGGMESADGIVIPKF